MPVDPESLLEQARSELSPDVTYKLLENAPEQPVDTPAPQAESQKRSRTEKKPKRLGVKDSTPVLLTM